MVLVCYQSLRTSPGSGVRSGTPEGVLPRDLEDFFDVSTVYR